MKVRVLCHHMDFTKNNCRKTEINLIKNKSASEHNIRLNKKVYTELCYYMENSILVAMATTLDDERMSRHTDSTVCTYVPNMKRES